LADLEKNERGNFGLNAAYSDGKMTFGEAMARFGERVEKDASLKPGTKEHRKYDGDVALESVTLDLPRIARSAGVWRRMEPTRNEIARDGVNFLRKVLA